VPRPLVIDCDPGHDDAFALLVAVARPELDLLAVTTVGGNGDLEKVTENARRVLTLAGASRIPVGAGADRPLAGELEPSVEVHGESALDGAELPEPEAPLDERGAIGLLADVLRAAESPVTVVATGPLTNVATLLESRPDLRSSIAEIVLMGGSADTGNTTPLAEFNIWTDPEAAAIVFGSGLPLTMHGLNLTHQALATPEVLARLRGYGTRLGTVGADWLEFFAASYRELWGFESPPVHDPCTVVELVAPGTVTFREAFVAVETKGEWTRGATVVDFHDRFGEPANVRVGMHLDAERFWDVVCGAVETLGAGTPG
jgi:inosine-uridine nucleoside N-ribohydrolase